MPDKDKNKDNEMKTLSDEDKALWALAVEDVKETDNLVERSLRRSGSRILSDMRGADTDREGQKKGHNAIPKKGHGDIDRKTYDRFRTGKMMIEARLDLHGLTQDKAYKTLLPFVEQSYQQGLRMILVVTGKGTPKGKMPDRAWYEPEPGILRRMFPEWLERAPLNKRILKYAPAQRKDGGDGAYYVLLKRKR